MVNRRYLVRHVITLAAAPLVPVMAPVPCASLVAPIPATSDARRLVVEDRLDLAVVAAHLVVSAAGGNRKRAGGAGVGGRKYLVFCTLTFNREKAPLYNGGKAATADVSPLVSARARHLEGGRE